MKIELQLCSVEDKFIINNIYPLYLHDLSEIWERKTNQYGVFEEDDTQTLADQNRVFDIWWEHPGVLFPYLIKADGLPAGLAFVATAPYMPCPDDIDYYLNEFFLLRHYRGKGVGEEALRQLFSQHPGHWEIHTNKTDRNSRAQGFYRRTLAVLTNGGFAEETGPNPEAGEMTIYRFRYENGEQTDTALDR
ncbi:GNAT family N-acetyltransferase [Paenibacillus kobensis]|uniref:GNAT family N-acetyltransferase n=1 Tax=Paenibacillus kobensis TaxID=59841 RepID=UPI000FDA1DF9|nr:GNAT family N-acetyltransferase [Paenibacillus kobensis]